MNAWRVCGYAMTMVCGVIWVVANVMVRVWARFNITRKIWSMQLLNRIYSMMIMHNI